MSNVVHPLLLTEDDPDSREAFALALEREGYTVVTASDGQEALSLLEKGLRPALLIIDLMMPRVTGWEVLRYLQNDRELRDIPRIVVTGVPENQVKSIADLVIMKPVSATALIMAVRHLTDGQPPRAEP